MPSPAESTEAVKLAARLFEQAKQPPRWPMYIRQIRQYLRNADETFDERKLGFAGIVEFLRACQREQLLRLERDRQGVMRVFPGAAFPKAGPGQTQEAQPPMSDAAAGEREQVPSFDGGEPVEFVATEARFLRVTDDDELPRAAGNVIEGEAVETPPAVVSTDAEEDLSVGPGNVAGRETHTMTTTAKVTRGAGPRAVGRKRAPLPRAPKGAPAVRARRAPRPKKTTG
jgi:hypothetical protein